MINIEFLIPAVIKQIFIVAAEFPIPSGLSSNETNAEIETQPVTPEVKIRKWST